MKIKEFVIKDAVFKTSVLFLVNCNYDEANKRLRRRGIDAQLREYEVGTVMKIDDETFFRIVWVEKFKDLGVLVHELLHLVVRIVEDKGVPIKANHKNGECGDETAAYLLEFYFNECVKKLKSPRFINKG